MNKEPEKKPQKAASLSAQTKYGLIWSTIERFSLQAVTFGVGLVLARLLGPKDYGTVALLTIFITISNSIIDSGFSNALIRKTDRTEVDNSTVFYFNIVAGLVMYGICFAGAPLIARFFKLPELTILFRFASITVFLNSLVVVQRALLTINLDFKTQAKASFSACIVSGTVALYLAYSGYGSWALVWQSITGTFVNMVLLWVFSSWRPRWVYSWKSFRELFSFGSKLLISGLLDVTYNQLRPMIIGRYFSDAAVGLYTKAAHFSHFPSSNITGILQRVTYPVLCKLQGDLDRLATIYRKLLRLSVFVIFPLMIGLASIATPLVVSLIGEKWHFSGTILSIVCFSNMFYPVASINLNLLQVQGRSDLFLRLEIIKKIVGLICLAISCYIAFMYDWKIGLMVIASFGILSTLIAIVINTYYTGKLIKVGFFMQMRDIFPSFLLSMAMFASIITLNRLVLFEALPRPAYLTIDILFGVLFYFGGAVLLRFPELQDAKKFILKK